MHRRSLSDPYSPVTYRRCIDREHRETLSSQGGTAACLPACLPCSWAARPLIKSVGKSITSCAPTSCAVFTYSILFRCRRFTAAQFNIFKRAAARVRPPSLDLSLDEKLLFFSFSHSMKVESEATGRRQISFAPNRHRTFLDWWREKGISKSFSSVRFPSLIRSSKEGGSKLCKLQSERG